MQKDRKLLTDICRIAFGAVFVFSGAMKCIDTWGTAQKVADYLTAFRFDWLSGMKVPLAVALSAFEFTMGAMLIFRVRPRLTSLTAFVFMIGFTLLTLGVAIWNPLDDCGCFGEALRMSNWHSFFKNVVLLALSAFVWYSYRREKFFPFTRRDVWLTLLFAGVSVLTGVLVYRHLPLVDMFPYKKGVNLRTDALCTACLDNETTLIYKDIQTGDLVRFSLADTTWHDSGRWEYVDTRTAFDDIPPEMLDEDFALYRGELNMADKVLDYPGRTVLVIMHDIGKVGAGCLERLENYVARQHDARIIVITEKADGRDVPVSVRMFGQEVPVLAMEPKPLGYLLRADTGIVTLEDGVVAGKRNCRDL